MLMYLHAFSRSYETIQEKSMPHMTCAKIAIKDTGTTAARPASLSQFGRSCH